MCFWDWAPVLGKDSEIRKTEHWIQTHFLPVRKNMSRSLLTPPITPIQCVFHSIAKLVSRQGRCIPRCWRRGVGFLNVAKNSFYSDESFNVPARPFFLLDTNDKGLIRNLTGFLETPCMRSSSWATEKIIFYYCLRKLSFREEKEVERLWSGKILWVFIGLTVRKVVSLLVGFHSGTRIWQPPDSKSLRFCF